MSELKIGLVGLDTSHVKSFTRMLKGPADPHHRPAARVGAGFRGETADWVKRADRDDGFTALVDDELGGEALDQPQQVAQCSDLMLIPSVDGRKDQIALGIPWLKHDQPQRIARYAQAYDKVADQAEAL